MFEGESEQFFEPLLKLNLGKMIGIKKYKTCGSTDNFLSLVRSLIGSCRGNLMFRQ